MRFYFLVCVSFLMFDTLSQTTNISGNINIYTPVVEFDACLNSRFRVSSASGFTPGDKVMIIQMMGAVIDETNTISFGTITSYNNAGKYEYGTIFKIEDDSIELEKALVNTYDVSGRVQLIRIPQYVNATVTGILRPQSWNGTTGGVLALEVSGTLTMNANIVADSAGFKVGGNQNPTNGCNFTQNWADYFYAIGNYRGNFKGNGITNVITNKECGRGPLANGGGGGNDHNSGGGGGGHIASGGNGGRNAEPGAFNCRSNNPGLGGKLLNTSGSRLFFGGAGGSGHQNNNMPSSGMSGGGIIYIKAATLVGNNRIISASSINAPIIQGDGGGGGGAGGSILLDVASFSNNVTINARGGNGGNTNNLNSNRCFGPGGGGSGGVIHFNGASFPGPGIVTTSVTGGAAGIVTLSTNACNGTTNTGTSGGNGNVVFSSSKVEGTASAFNCNPLPVELLSFNVSLISDNRALLKWQTASEINNDRFEVQHSMDGYNFTKIGEVKGNGNTNQLQYYEFRSTFLEEGNHYFRLKQIDFNQTFSYSGVRVLTRTGIHSYLKNIKVFPNPSKENADVFVELSGNGFDIEVTLMDQLGNFINHHFLSREENYSSILRLQDLFSFSKGVFYIKFQTENETVIKKVVVL